MRALLQGGPADGREVHVPDVAVQEYVAFLDGRLVTFSSYPDTETLERLHGCWEKYEAIDPAGATPVVFTHCS